jgi:hypothetical protein
MPILLNSLKQEILSLLGNFNFYELRALPNSESNVGATSAMPISNKEITSSEMPISCMPMISDLIRHVKMLKESRMMPALAFQDFGFLPVVSPRRLPRLKRV